MLISHEEIPPSIQYSRITVEQRGCQMILTHIKHQEILNRLLVALDVTDSNRSTNIAFAIARLIEEEEGKKVLINDCGQNKFVSFHLSPFLHSSLFKARSSTNHVEYQR